MATTSKHVVNSREPLAERLVNRLLENPEPLRPDTDILAAKKRRYAQLDKQWDELDNGDAANLTKQRVITSKMVKLRQDIERWDKLYATCK